MSNTLKFSVIIAVYNGARTVAEAIESVLVQTYAPHEIIVVDDGSTDATADVVRQFSGPVKYVNQANAGVAVARNKGAELATGDWLVFLDADDYYYPERLQWQAELLGQHPGLDFMTGDFDYIKPDRSLIRRSMESTPTGRELLASADGQRFVLMSQQQLGGFIGKHFGDTHTLAIPRQTFVELGGYPVGIAVCEDVNLLIRLCARSQQVGVVCKPMAAYVIHGDSATRSDPLRAQKLTVEALLPLRQSLGDAPRVIREGLEECIRSARMDLAYVLVKMGKRAQAIQAVLPLLIEQPGMVSLRAVLSIAKG